MLLRLTALAAALMFAGSTLAAHRIKVGFVSTLSGPGAGLGVDIRDIARAGPRVTATVTASILLLGAIALAAIRLAGLG